MDGKTHLVAGALAGIGIVALESKLGVGNVLDNTFIILGSSIGSLLPDMDHDKAYAGRVIPLWLFMEHRTYTHSLFFMGAVGAITTLFGLPISLTVGLLLGILTHLLLDSTTYMGINWIYPIGESPENRIKRRK